MTHTHTHTIKGVVRWHTDGTRTAAAQTAAAPAHTHRSNARTLYDGSVATHWNAFLKMSSVNEENHQHFLISETKNERLKELFF